MNNRIHILDKSVAARIAAGEVVVNPAAVVKELVENSMDAYAKAVTVEIRDGGKTLIRVTDNGVGIEAQDVPLAIQKHATSKIGKLEDLEEIGTLGFRGEALASMAAVSRLTISTRTQNSMEGALLCVTGGSEPEISAAGLPEGTTVKVENLFFNVPARKKFLKNTGSETAQVTSVMSKLILANPGIAIKYISNDKTVFQSPGTGDLKDALLSVYGKQISERIHPVSYENSGITITGYLSKPAFLYKSTHYFCLFLNGRLVQSKNIQAAVMRGYGQRLLRGQYPFAVLHINLPFSMADVNVHPNKLQVMLYDEPFVLQTIEAAVEDALKENTAPAFEVFSPMPQQAESKGNTMAASKPNDTKADEVSKGDSLHSDFQRSPAFPGSVKQTPGSVMPPRFESSPEFDSLLNEVAAFQKQEEPQLQIEIEDVRHLCNYRIIGQAWNTFLIVESGEVLYLIDQHAAHERINYERMKRQAQEGTSAMQSLLVPYAATLAAQEFDLWMQNEDLLRSLGFEFEEFGALSLKFTALPSQVNRSSASQIIEDILYEIKNSHGDVLLLRDQIIRASCRYSIKAGYQLSDEQIAELMHEITELDAIPHCPHGRPIAIALTKNDLEKGFKRIV
ncbi:MAG: DNA mismatch repair endonuclease MutL [Christensenella sp.]|nr:DNA mismatch repair endonuclease MutL [Christensenella sp.]